MDPEFLANLIPQTKEQIRPACKKCGYAGHLTYQCRNFLKVDPNKDIVLDVSSTTSESEDDYTTPLTNLRAEELKKKLEEAKKRIKEKKKKKKSKSKSKSRKRHVSSSDEDDDSDSDSSTDSEDDDDDKSHIEKSKKRKKDKKSKKKKSKSKKRKKDKKSKSENSSDYEK